VCLALPLYRNSFSSMAKATLGTRGQIIAWLCTLLLLYSLTAAYISGSSALISDLFRYLFNIHLPAIISGLCFTVFFALFVTIHTRAVDILNRGLISVKGFFLILTLSLLLPSIHLNLLYSSFKNVHYLAGGSIIFLSAFGFHTVIPSMVNYQGIKPKLLRGAILTATSLILIIYLFWLSCALGIIPLTGTHGYTKILAHPGNVSGLIDALNALTHSKWVHVGINIFANIAMTTSFLGVTLGLFDFLADGFKRQNTVLGRIQTSLITFIPPFIVGILYPSGFVIALEYAGIFVGILLVIYPAAMVYKLRHSKTLTSPYRLMGGTPLLFIVGSLGLVFLFIAAEHLVY